MEAAFVCALLPALGGKLGAWCCGEGVLVIMHGRSSMTIEPRIPTMPGRAREVARVGGGVLDRRDVLDLMHGRSRMTLYPRISTTPVWSMSGLTDQADIACTKREAKRDVFSWGGGNKYVAPSDRFFIRNVRHQCAPPIHTWAIDIGAINMYLSNTILLHISSSDPQGMFDTPD